MKRIVTFGLSAFLFLSLGAGARAWISHGYSDYIQIDTVTAVDGSDLLPLATSITTVFPNPFNPRTSIAFELSDHGPINLVIYDVQGRLVRVLDSGSRPAGRYLVVWSGQDDKDHEVATGIYFCRLSTMQDTKTRKLLLIR